MPGDVTGSLIYDASTAQFSFREGPVFTNLLLADEINRTPPEDPVGAARVDGGAAGHRSTARPRPLPDPFCVIATQNPVEYEGTYPLPEAQLDRFLLKVTMPLPDRDTELRVLAAHAAGFDPRDLAGAGVGAGGRARPICTRASRGRAPGPRRTRACSPTSSSWSAPPARRRPTALGVSPARRHRAGRHGARLGLAVGPRLRHPRRRPGAGPADLPAPHRSCGPRPSSRA